MWDEKSGFYYDLHADGQLGGLKTLGAYWALLAGIVPENNLEKFVAHLQNPHEFKRPHLLPTLSADHPDYKADGGYWRGGVWTPTNYMVLEGLKTVNYFELAHQIGLNHLANVVKIFEETGTLWENYAPEVIKPGNPAKPDFVGWSGLPPIAVLFEHVFGVQPDVPNAKLIWDVRLLEEHGIKQYPFGNSGLVDLHCAARSSQTEKPSVQAISNIPLDLVIRWQNGEEIRKLG
jgi:glycogen debranching enzyme